MVEQCIAYSDRITLPGYKEFISTYLSLFPDFFSPASKRLELDIDLISLTVTLDQPANPQEEQGNDKSPAQSVRYIYPA